MPGKIISSVYNSVLPLNRFSFLKKDGKLIAEASDFGPSTKGYWWLSRLYNDACDVGIAIRSHKTGRVEVFYLTEEERQEGDLLAFHFAPLSKTCPVKEVVILND